MARRSTRLMDKELIVFGEDSDVEVEDSAVFGIPIEDSDDELEESEHDTDSEQELTDDEHQDEEEEDDSFFTGKDGTVWNKKPNSHKGFGVHKCNQMKLGPDKTPKDLETSEDFFSLFIDDFVIKKIVGHTNDFINCFIPEDKRKGTYRLTNETEVNGWIGLNILIGTQERKRQTTLARRDGLRM